MILRQFVRSGNSIEEIYIVKPENCDSTVEIPETPGPKGSNAIVAIDNNIMTVSTSCDNSQPCSVNADLKCVEPFSTNSSAAPDSSQSTNILFVCNLCDKQFKSNLILQHHLKASHQHMLPFKCNTCASSEMRTVGMLNKHFSQHDQNKPYKCIACEARFKSALNRASHQRLFHQAELPIRKRSTNCEIRRYACRYCDKRFLAKSNFERHERNHEKVLMNAGETGILDFLYHCFICRMQYDCKDSLNDHLNVHADQLPYQCDKCVSSNLAILSVRLLNKHLALHMEEKPIKCIYCTDTFISIAECQTHERLKHTETSADDSCTATLKQVDPDRGTRFQCSFCNNSYSLLSTLRRHENSHTRKRQFICKTCGKIFYKSSCLSQHERIHLVDAPYKCSYCGKGFKETIRMIEHRRIHTGEKPFQCDNCSEKFRIKPQLKEHLEKCAKKVVPLQNYQCEYCDQQFSSKNLLIDHSVELHSGHLSTEGRCKYCDLQFKSLPALLEHEMQHRLPDAIECNQCGRIFKQLANLRRHLRLHSLNATPYKCDLCGKSFSQSSTMKVHRRAHTGEKPYKCDLCLKSFHHSSTKNRHKRSHFEKGSKLFLSLEN